MKRIWTAVVAVALVAVLLALLVPTVGVVSGNSAAPSAAPPANLNAPLSGALKASVLAQASAAAAKAGMSPSATQLGLAHIAQMSPAEILSSAGLTPATIRALSCGFLGGTCQQNGEAGLTGCIVGGVLGASAGPIGAGIGCAVGAAAALVEFQFGLSQAADQQNLQQAALQWSSANIATASNEWNLTNTAYANIASALNFSAIAFQRMADNAALLQLGNQSFSIRQDEVQSGLVAQMSTILQAYANQMFAPLANLNTWWIAQMAPGAVYSGQGYELVAGGTGFGAPQLGEYDAFHVDGPSIVSGSAFNSTVYIPPNGILVSSCYAAGVGYYIRPVFGGPWVSLTRTAITGGGGAVLANLTLPSGLPFNAQYYQLSLPYSTACQTFVPGGQVVSNGAGDISGWSSTAAGQYFNLVSESGTQYFGLPNAGISTSQACFEISTGACATYAAKPVSGPTALGIGTWLGTLEQQAATNGESYWSFLRSIGYTSEKEIPPNCLVPAPYQVLPSDVNLGNLTLKEIQTLYMAWLQGLGNFYNVSLSGTAFCGTQAPKQFNLGNTTWGNLQVNATGYVYLNNGTSPIGLNGKALVSELYSNTSTWALTKDQLLLMPTLGTVHIPVGVKWAVPQNNPIEIYAVQPGQMFRATGNGTASPAALVPLATAAPGDSLYLTSCVVGGAAQTNCTVTVQTINVTLANLSCGLGPTGPGSCQTQPSGGTFGGFPNPFSWLAGLFSGLFGGGPLGSFLSGLAAGLVILIVIAVLVYVAVIEVEAWGGRKKRGDGGGGSTVVVQGGR